MQIRFGWLLDGAAWAERPHPSAPATKPHSELITQGPRGLITILMTHLGLRHPETPHAVRIAQYRTLAAITAHPWYQESLALDPWNTAAALLTLRDDAIENGWRITEAQAPSNPRLAALATIERGACVGGVGTKGANLAPGYADDLAEVHRELAKLADGGVNWPLGISYITCAENPSELPGRWPHIFELLDKLGVNVTAEESGSEGPINAPKHVQIHRAPQELTAGENAAEIISELLKEGEALTVLATADTLVLDAELAKLNLPPVAHIPAGAQRLSSQVLPLFFQAVSSPLDVHALAALLSLEIPRDERLADPTAKFHGTTILPSGASRELLGALTEEPGIDLNDPESAFAKAMTEIRSGTTDQRELNILDGLCECFTATASSEPCIGTREIEGKLDLLSQIVNALPLSVNVTKAQINAHIDLLHTLVELNNEERLSTRQFSDLMAAAAPAIASPLAFAEVAPFERAISPAHIRGGNVLWWGAHETQSRPAATWDAPERLELEQHGARIISPEQLSSLTAQSIQRALGNAEKLLIVLPEVARGRNTPIHSAIPGVLHAWALNNPDLVAEGATQNELMNHPLVATNAHGHARTALENGTKSLPSEWIPVPPKSAKQQVKPGLHLMPTALSYTQLELLHRNPVDWVLKYPFGIRPGKAAQIPTGNRMIGTLVHRIIEDLVNEGKIPANYKFDAESMGAITEVFERLVPRFASELNLPGNSALRAAVLTATKHSISTLFSTLQREGISYQNIELSLSGTELPLTINAGTRTEELSIAFGGSIDFMGIDMKGTKVVLDFKWSNSRNHYNELVRHNTALQLATYAWALSENEELSREPRTGYYLLKYAEFASADPALGGGSSNASSLELFTRLRTTIENNLSHIAQGNVTSPQGDLVLDSFHPESEPQKTLAKQFAQEAEERGEIYVDSPITYSDYTIITGIAGDYS